MLALEGSIGLVDGEPSLSLRAVLARETDRGLETLAGEIAARESSRSRRWSPSSTTSRSSARSTRRPASGCSTPARPGPASVASAVPVPLPRPAPGRRLRQRAGPAPSRRARSVEREPPARPARSSRHGGVMPQRPVAPPGPISTPPRCPSRATSLTTSPSGACDVVKSDGDRLHLKIHKDGRIREIALEMLRVTPLDDSESGTRRFKLERRM